MQEENSSSKASSLDLMGIKIEDEAQDLKGIWIDDCEPNEKMRLPVLPEL